MNEWMKKNEMKYYWNKSRESHTITIMMVYFTMNEWMIHMMEREKKTKTFFFSKFGKVKRLYPHLHLHPYINTHHHMSYKVDLWFIGSQIAFYNESYEYMMNLFVCVCASVWSKIFLFSHYYHNHSLAKKKQFFFVPFIIFSIIITYRPYGYV